MKRPPLTDDSAQDQSTAMIRLRDLVTALSPSLELLIGDAPLDGVMSSVEIHDIAVTAPPVAGTVLLAVGVDGSEAHELVSRLRGHVGAIILAHRCPLDDNIARRAAADGTAILRLAAGVGWRAVAHRITTLLEGEQQPVLSNEEFGRIPDGDLFELANVLCRMIDAPVTIEDRNTNVLAFSTRQDEADYVRIASILQRTRPHDYLETSMDAVLQSDRPIFLPATKGAEDRVVMPRVAVAIRDGEQLLGSIWAVVQAPLGKEREQLLSDAARVATHHFRRFGTSQRDSSVVEELMSAVLEGGVAAADAAARLEITIPAIVVSVELDGLSTPAPASELTGYLSRVAWRTRICSALNLHLRGVSAQSLVASLANRVYAIVPLRGKAPEDLLRACQTFVERIGGNPPLYIGLGRTAATIEDLSRSREDADSTARTLHALVDGRQVATAADVLVDSLLVDLRELARSGSRGPTGPFARLLEYDRLRSAHLVETLQAWLDAFGDVTAAASGCDVHSNTFRYRLMRIGEVGEVDLNDAEQRFALEFQLRLFGDRRVQVSVGAGLDGELLELTHPPQ